jgi:hypothetical protein
MGQPWAASIIRITGCRIASDTAGWKDGVRTEVSERSFQALERMGGGFRSCVSHVGSTLATGLS